MGYFPLSLSTTGAEYAERSTVREVAAGGEETAEALATLKAQQLRLAKGASDDVNELREQLKILDGRLSKLDDSG